MKVDLCIQDVLNGTAREKEPRLPGCGAKSQRTLFLRDRSTERYLTEILAEGIFLRECCFPLRCAVRRLAGLREIRYALRKYIEKQVQERYFLWEESVKMGLPSFHPAQCGRNCKRKM